MSFPPRLVVTGHNAQGRGVVSSDATADSGITRRNGHCSYVLWATETVPADLGADHRGARPIVERSLDGGTVFRIVEYGPGVAPAKHRTESIDYAVVLSGEIDLVLDEETVRLRRGDTLVQRGTAHDWVNNGIEPCVIAFCLVGARDGDSAAESA